MTKESISEPLLSFNPDTGSIKWLTSRGRMKAGDEAGRYDRDGYVRVTIKSKTYLAHRLMWLFVHKTMPPDGVEVDHINHVRDDNRISNLRLSPFTSVHKNQHNRSLGKNNTSGHMGVRRSGEKWRAEIKIDGKKVSLGTYSLLEDAVTARKEAELKYGFHKNHGSPPPKQRNKILGLAQK